VMRRSRDFGGALSEFGAEEKDVRYFWRFSSFAVDHRILRLCISLQLAPLFSTSCAFFRASRKFIILNLHWTLCSHLPCSDLILSFIVNVIESN
jgi:hypothetical protein